MISHIIFKTSLLFFILNGISGREMNEIGSSIEQKSVDQQNNVRDKSNIIKILKWIFDNMTFSLIFRDFFSFHNCDFPKWVSWNNLLPKLISYLIFSCKKYYYLLCKSE